MSDERLLLSNVVRGDRKAMETLYGTYAGFATAVARRYVHDTNDVRDVLQDSFIKVFTNIKSFSYRGEGSLKAWIMRIVANEAISSLRKSNRLIFTDKFPEMDADIPDPDLDEMSPEVINNLIGKLPPGYRTVLNMYVFEHRSHKEIAHELGIKEDTSASQFHRAKLLLSKMITEYKVRRSV